MEEILKTATETIAQVFSMGLGALSAFCLIIGAWFK